MKRSDFMMDLCLINCKFYSDGVLKDSDYSIGVKDGKISEISLHKIKSDETIDLKGKLILPGLIDPHVHFRDPGLTYKEDFKTGSQAAANGGFTTIMDMPNTIPKTNNFKNFKYKKNIALKKSIVDFALHASFPECKGFQNEDSKFIDEITKISKLNPASFKIFMDLYENYEIVEMFKGIDKLNQIRKKSHIISVHCEDKNIVEHNTNEVSLKEKLKAIDYAEMRPAYCENISVSNAIALAIYYNVNLNICHLSSKLALDMVNEMKLMFKRRGISLSSEITPHHLFLNSNNYNDYGNIAKTNPPLRPLGENINLHSLDKIDMIGTDHAPHTIEEKTKEVLDSSPGIPNLEVLMPLLLTRYNKNQISIESIERLLCKNPSNIFNLVNKGSITVGKDADFCVLDLNVEGRIDPDKFYSKAKYSPFEGYEYKGNVYMTISNGNVIMEEGEVYKNKGKYVLS